MSDFLNPINSTLFLSLGQTLEITSYTKLEFIQIMSILFNYMQNLLNY